MTIKERTGYHISDQFATYFVTFTTVGWIDLFTRKECQDIIISSLNYCQSEKGLTIHAYVIMSSHLHLIVTANPDSDGLSNIIRDFKGYTSKQLITWTLQSQKESRRDWLEVVYEYHAKYNSNNKHFQVWKQDNHPMVCLHPRFTRQKLDYLHLNPVVAGLVVNPEDFRLSSARNYAGLNNTILPVSIIDFGIEEGYVMT